MSKDTVYQQPQAAIGNFQFDDTVARVFPDMIGRSVPGYSLMVEMIGVLAERHVLPHTTCYDLGSSLGACSFAMAQKITAPNCKIIGIDNSAAMIERANMLKPHHPAITPIQFIQQDLLDVEFAPSSMIVMNFTLQFIAREVRDELLSRLYQALVPNGILVLSEKLQFADPAQDQELFEMHHAFKRAQGYSTLEIAQKRTALENVLLPDTAELHVSRLKQAGFAEAMLWFQCFNFASFVAIKR
jgi:tRNA (cmo5U34)-methyltransferase